MGISSTFGIFTTARLGIYSSQKAMEVVGNNISNINTTGYTRQVVDQKSLYIGGSDRYQSELDSRVGGGALVTGINQLRDPYLDIRYRNETSSVGMMDGKMAGLEQISSILDEVGKGTDGEGLMEAQFNELIEQMEKLATPDSSQNGDDTLVKSAASSLVSLFNTYADKLDTLMKNQTTQFKQDVTTVNGLLENIRELNENIRRSDIHGGGALEMRDERNRLIDELSQYVRINVTYSQEELAQGVSVEKLTISLAGNDTQQGNHNGALLIDGIYGTQFSIKDEENFDIQFEPLQSSKGEVMVETTTEIMGTNFPAGTTKEQIENDINSNSNTYPKEFVDTDGVHYTYTYEVVGNNVDGWKVQKSTTAPSTQKTMTDNDLYGSLQAERGLLTEKGEYASETEVNHDPDARTKRGIPYYQKTLDALANKFAKVMNEANSVTEQDTNADGTPKVDADGKPVMKVTMGGYLFSNNGNGDDIDNITASNLSISKGWSSSAIKMLASKDPDAPSTDNSNYLHILNLMTGKQDYAPSDTEPGLISDTADKPYFSGSFQEMFNHISSTLADDTKVTKARLENYSSAQDELYEDRDSVSGVDLNDEAMNMMQFQKSYSAACRLMTTVDTMLDKLINGMAV